MRMVAEINQTMSGQVSARAPRSFLCFLVLCSGMFLNLILAVLHARGLPVSNGLVTAVQAVITAVALPAFFSPRAHLADYAWFALGFMALCVIATNLVNPFDPKTIYDIFIIPIYIVLGMSAASVKPKWMHWLLVFVLAGALLEIVAPSLYTTLVDPLGYLSSTRGWLEEVAAKAGTGDASLDWVNRAGGSQLGFSDHRVAGPFLEPLSLGYFAALMAIYYCGLYNGSGFLRYGAIIICLGLTLAADSRVPTMLIIATCLLLLPRPKLPSVLLWLTFPVVMGVMYAAYLFQSISLYSDAGLRLSLTFGVIANSDIIDVLIGAISLERANDSGIVYLLRCVGPVGLIVSVWFFGGAFTRWRGTNVAFFVSISVYVSVTLMFGGATLSIKTASLLGYLVGLASRARMILTDQIADVGSSEQGRWSGAVPSKPERSSL